MSRQTAAIQLIFRPVTPLPPEVQAILLGFIWFCLGFVWRVGRSRRLARFKPGAAIPSN